MSWPSATLGEVCDIVSGATPKTGNPDFWDGEVPWVTPKDLSKLNHKYLSDTPRKITDAGLRSCSARMLPAHSVLFSSRAPIGLVAINTLPVCTNQGFKSMVPRASRICSDYLYWWLSTHRESLQLKGRGATFKEVSKKIVEAVQIPLPPLAEQKRIAGILDAADALRAKRRESLAQLDTLLQSTFLDMFGDPVTNPMGWDVVPITEAVEGKYGIKAGPFGSALKKADYASSGFRVYGQEQVIAGRFDIGDYYIDERKFKNLQNCAVTAGDILVSLVGSFGKVLIVPDGTEPGIINPRLLKITPRQELVTSLYLATLIRSEATQRKLESMSHGGTMGILNAGLFKQLTVPTPPLDLQHRFAAIVESVEQQKASQRAHLAELDTLFASLQSRAFRGDL